MRKSKAECAVADGGIRKRQMIMDFPALAPLVNLHQNQLRFWGLSFASVGNTNSSPTATETIPDVCSHLQKLWLSWACYKHSSAVHHTVYTDRHMAALHIRALRTRHVWELAEPCSHRALPGPPRPAWLCGQAQTAISGLGVAIFRNSASLLGPTEGTSTCGYLLAGC